MIPVSVVWRVLGWALLAAVLGFVVGAAVGFSAPWLSATIAGLWMFVWSIRAEARKSATGRGTK